MSRRLRSSAAFRTSLATENRNKDGTIREAQTYERRIQEAGQAGPFAGFDRRGAVAADAASTASMRAPRSSKRSSTGLTAFISSYRDADTEVLRFPPVMSRRQIEKSGYLKSFPHFLGCVSCLGGAEDEIQAQVERYDAGGDWTSGLAAADLVLSPAACYPVYPLVASRGHVPADRTEIRRRLRLLPPRAVKDARPAAVVPHARICLHRHAGTDPGIPRALDQARRRFCRRNWASNIASITPAIRSSAAAAS